MAKTRAKPRKKPASSGGLDPRLVELARYLARRAAERDYQALRKMTDDPEEAPDRRRKRT